MEIFKSSLEVFLLLLVLPWPSKASLVDDFSQCLSKNSDQSHRISDSIYTHNDSDFEPTLQAHASNLRFTTPTTPKPLAIVTAQHETHIQAVVKCSKSLSLRIRIRSGGNDYEGQSYVSRAPFVVLDMNQLRSISIDMEEKTAWVEAGVTVGELYYKIGNVTRNYAFPGGVYPLLGTGGHFSCVGYGNLMRKYGLTSDNIIDARVVNARGAVLDRRLMGEDLFWAIKGGGGSSFAVIVSWKIKLVPVPDLVTVFSIDRYIGKGETDLLWRYQQIADMLDDDIFIRIVLSSARNPNTGNRAMKATFLGLFLGQTQRLLSLTDESFHELGLARIDCTEMSWIESAVYWAGLPRGASPEALLERTLMKKDYLKKKSDYVQHPVPKKGLEELRKRMVEAEDVVIQWNPMGGMMGRIHESATPFPHRAGNRYKIQYIVNWDKAEETKHNLDMISYVYDGMTPYVSKLPRRAFLIFRDLDIGTNSGNGSFSGKIVCGVRYFVGNFKRLVRVKAVVDPENFFQDEQSIPVLPS